MRRIEADEHQSQSTAQQRITRRLALQGFERRPRDRAARRVDAMAIEKAERRHRAARGDGERRRLVVGVQKLRVGNALDALQRVCSRRRQIRDRRIRRFRALCRRGHEPQQRATKAPKGASAPSAFARLRAQFEFRLLRARGEFHVMRASKPFLMEVDDEILLQLLAVPGIALQKLLVVGALLVPIGEQRGW